jgi:hypothetical protein
MSQKIVTLCDAHQAHDEERPGLSWEVTLLAPGATKATTWAVDLCEDDGKTLEDLATMLTAVGRVTDGPRKRVTRDVESRTAANAAARVAARNAQESHTAPRTGRTNVGANAPVGTELETAEGFPCPVDGCDKVPATRVGLMSHLKHYHDGLSLAEATGAPMPYPCQDCDRRFSHAQGLAAHRRSAHGVAGGSGAA